MGRRRYVLFISYLAFVLASAVFATAARAQTPNAPASVRDRALTPQETDRFYEDINKLSGVRMYEGLCARAKEFVAKKGAVNDPLLSQFNTYTGVDVINALLNYCATGRFILYFYDKDRKCPVKTVLSSIQMDLIRRLPFVRSSDVEIIGLGCVQTTEKFSLFNVRAHSIAISDSDLGGIEITGGTLTYNLEIFDSVIRGPTKIESMTIGSSLDITRSKFGPVDGKETMLSVKASALGSIWIRNAQVNGDVFIDTNQIKGNAKIGLYNAQPRGPQDVNVLGGFSMTNNDVRGDLQVTSTRISGYLDLRGNVVERGYYVCRHTTVGEWFELFASRAGTMELCDLDVAGNANAVGLRVAESVYIGQSSGGTGKEEVNFKKGLNMRNLKADRLRVMNANITEELTLTAMTVSSVSILNSNVGKKIHSGDARVSSIAFRNSTVPDFECSDCVVSIYMLLAGKFSGEVNLRGAQIKAGLVFRDGERDVDASIWAPGSRLDLRSIQAESIEADYCDLLVKSESGEKCKGPFVPTLMTGATFKNFVPGRNPKVMGMTSGLLDQGVDKIVEWIKTSRGEERFHPQPYDLMADALDRAGRHSAAVEVRVAKLDDDYASGNYSWFMRGVAKVASILTGYGYHNERSVWAFAGLIVIGMAVFLFGRHVSPIRLRAMKFIGLVNVLWYSFWFSVDRAVPPLHIDEAMKEYSILNPGARAYFYFHRGAGMIILSFFVAGISGLFK